MATAPDPSPRSDGDLHLADRSADLGAWKSAGWMKQKEPGLFAVRLRIVGGRLTAEHLEALSRIARRFGRGVVHLTARQGVELPYVRGGDRDALVAALAESGLAVGVCGPRLRTITACQGGICRHGRCDPQALAARFDEQFFGRPGLPHKFKIGLAGCANGCTKPLENDLGIAGAVENLWHPDLCTACGLCVEVCPSQSLRQPAPDRPPQLDATGCVRCGRCVTVCPSGAWSEGRAGFLLYVGGMMGAVPHLGHRLGGMVLGEDRLLEIAERLVALYAAEGRPGERFARTVDRLGLEAVRRAAGVDP